MNSKNGMQDESRTLDGGDIWDQIGLREIKALKHKVLHEGISKYQDINVVEAKDIRMYLNEQLQFSSLDERIYHEALVHPAMTLTKKRTRVLILGGGDGLALREVLKYSDVKRVDLVDIDSEIIKVAKSVRKIVELNEGSFLDRRVKVHIQDAQKYVSSNTRKYNVIIVDFPDPANEILCKLYTKELFSRLYSFLADDGVLVCQSNSPDDAPLVYWSIGRTIRSVGFDVMSYHTIVPSFGDWGFHIAAKKFRTKRMDKLSINVPYGTLPKDLSSLFQFKDYHLYGRRYAKVNTLDQLTLHRFYQQEMDY
ncbi:spermidine synthase [Peribacillus sp. NPDC096447]|uniref:spermine/spermidine synthase domain-containing protein n=1 Tax=Peribacillus sp. NPDC096447 TaxID=3364394 RepID=UPI0037F3C58F